MSFAFVFPGQGSQSVGMMAAYGDAAVVRATFDEASAALGDDLWAMVADGPAEVLTQTVNTQPVKLTAGIAALRAEIDDIVRALDHVQIVLNDQHRTAVFAEPL